MDAERWLPFRLATPEVRMAAEEKLLRIQRDRDRDSMKRNNFALLAELAGIDEGPAYNFLVVGVPVSEKAAEAIETWLNTEA